MSDAITPFNLAIPQAQIDDLHRRLDNTRWPERETVQDWSQGSPLAKVQPVSYTHLDVYKRQKPDSTFGYHALGDALYRCATLLNESLSYPIKLIQFDRERL